MSGQVVNAIGDYAHSSPSLLEDAELAFNNLSHQEVQLIKETEELFKQQVDYMIKIDRLKEYIPDFGTINSDTKKLSTLVESSYLLVEEVCSKFRHIDSAKTRVEDSLSKIGDILDLKTCREGVISAMRSNNYEEAAIHIKRFLSIDVGRSGIGSAIEATRELDEAKSKLLKICRENMTQAINRGNLKDVERFFKIFPLLNEHQDGLQRYSNFLKSKLTSLNLKETNHGDKLAAFYENVAKLIDSHQPVIETYYGPGYLIVFIKAIQKECDCVSRRILDDFGNATDLQTVASMVYPSSHLPIIMNTPHINAGSSHSANNLDLALNPKLDPIRVDKILIDISKIISRSEVYLSFIIDRIQNDIESKTEDEMYKKSRKLELYNFIYSECELKYSIQRIGGIYVTLEQFYLNESSKKAILMDKIESDPSSENCFISSMLDDIFFIIKKCTKRATSTKSNEVFCAIINHCITFLNSTFCQILEGRLKSQQNFTLFSTKNLDFSQAYNAIQFGQYPQRKTNCQYFSALNNLDKAREYIKTLRTMLDSDAKKLKPSTLMNNNNQLEKSITCLNELSSLVGRFTSIINSTLYQLFNTSLRARIGNELKTILAENPDLTNQLADSNTDEQTSLAKSLLKISDACLEDSFYPDIYSKLVAITKEYVLTTIKSMK